MLETLRTIVGHVHAIHVQHVAAVKRRLDKEEEHLVAASAVLRRCWRLLRGVLTRLVDATPKITSSKQSLDLVRSLVKSVTIKSMEIVVVTEVPSGVSNKFCILYFFGWTMIIFFFLNTN